jgi:hypothetical protein
MVGNVSLSSGVLVGPIFHSNSLPFLRK